MRKRLITSLGLAAVGLPAILFGGIFYYFLIGTFLIGAAWEYAEMFCAVKFELPIRTIIGGVIFIAVVRIFARLFIPQYEMHIFGAIVPIVLVYYFIPRFIKYERERDLASTKIEPQIHITIAGVALITFARMFFPQYALPVFEATILVALAYHLIAYERGRDQAALDFGLTVTGLAYIGWIGSYLFSLRNLHEGGWWFMLVMFCVWLGDSGAYSIGRYYGRHKMAPRLSPKKSWEGYAASVFTATLGGMFFVYAFTTYGNLAGQIAIWQGAILGCILGAFPPLGDLGESMIKRQSGIKDSSDVIPGHGGFFDRIDSWIWGAVIGYYFLVWFVI